MIIDSEFETRNASIPFFFFGTITTFFFLSDFTHDAVIYSPDRNQQLERDFINRWMGGMGYGQMSNN